MLVDDLRAFARDPKGYPDSAAAHLCSDAADVIVQDRAALAMRNSDFQALVIALGEIAELADVRSDEAAMIARQALDAVGEVKQP